MNRNRSALTLQHRKEIIDFTIKKRLPGMFVAKEWVTVGGLMSYGENLSDMYHRGAYFVDKILKGAKPADLPGGGLRDGRSWIRTRDLRLIRAAL